MKALNPPASIGFLGLGRMGMPMATLLVAGGYEVAGYDPSGEARSAFTQAGGAALATMGEATTDRDVIILMLPDSNVVEQVIRDEAFRAAAGAVIVDMSSSEPLRTRALAAELSQRNITFVDAPVSGGVSRAKAGTLTIMTGGDEEVLASLEPILRHIGTPVRTGSVGAGHATKAINNLLSASHLLATAEAMGIGERFGLDPKVMLSVINTSSGRSGSTENKWPNFVLPGTFDSGFGLTLMLKDMRIAVDLAQQMGAPARLSVDAAQLWSDAAAALTPDADHTEIARWVRDSGEQG